MAVGDNAGRQDARTTERRQQQPDDDRGSDAQALEEFRAEADAELLVDRRHSRHRYPLAASGHRRAERRHFRRVAGERVSGEQPLVLGLDQEAAEDIPETMRRSRRGSAGSPRRAAAGGRSIDEQPGSKPAGCRRRLKRNRD